VPGCHPANDLPDSPLAPTICLDARKVLHWECIENHSQLEALPQETAKQAVFSVSTLEQVAVGSTACVRDVAGEDSTSLRLLEMGLTPGVNVRVVGTAPLGDPLELELRGYRLSVRRTEAARVAIS
jgi:ferrous iron transport protein A